MVLKVESKSSSALRKEAQSEVRRGTAPRGRPRLLLPVVQQDVRGPDLVRGEAEVLHPGMLALVPLEVVVEPALRHTDTFFMFARASAYSPCRSKQIIKEHTETRGSHHPQPDVGGEDLVLLVLQNMGKHP